MHLINEFQVPIMCFICLRNGCKKVEKVTLSWRIYRSIVTLIGSGREMNSWESDWVGSLQGR